MLPWTLLGRAPIPGTQDRLLLWQRGDEFSIRISGYVSELMNSRLHGSEEALATQACTLLGNPQAARVLVGGLGMGFTLAAALRAVGEAGSAVVAELVPEVVEWNRGALGAAAGRPLDDPRVSVLISDVAEVIRAARADYDAVLLDVDNGPEGMTQQENNWLYTPAGLAAARRALRPGGVLAVWSAEQDTGFTARLTAAGYAVQVRTVHARTDKSGRGRGARHTIWLAQLNEGSRQG
ncbi:hypothetical protein [Deinococcus ruber]|uniref:Spermidine synthase n=1 Tax=Deinococcus ruber TaxID=1848197 RepID=A0A918F573_9DEIO|nr:hypothetical protein [Deinococcus ruber]GGR02410.1 hypothetical protein GCM10008957_14220 [Deinococcus ruber]